MTGRFKNLFFALTFIFLFFFLVVVLSKTKPLTAKKISGFIPPEIKSLGEFHFLPQVLERKNSLLEKVNKRGFWIGVYPLLPLWQKRENIEVFDKVMESSDITVNLDDGYLEQVKTNNFKINARGLQEIRIVDVLENRQDRDEKNWFAIGKNSFSQDVVKQNVKDVSFFSHSDFFNLGFNIDRLYNTNPDEFDRFVSLYKEIYREAKKNSPGRLVFPSFDYENISGKLDGKEKWFLVDKFLGSIDLLAISTYPTRVVKEVEEMGENYYEELNNRYPGMKKAIIDSGWSTTQTNEEEQSNFLIYLKRKSKDLNLIFWLYRHLFDPPPTFSSTYQGAGLRTMDDLPKKGYSTWLKIFNNED